VPRAGRPGDWGRPLRNQPIALNLVRWLTVASVVSPSLGTQVVMVGLALGSKPEGLSRPSIQPLAPALVLRWIPRDKPEDDRGNHLLAPEHLQAPGRGIPAQPPALASALHPSLPDTGGFLHATGIRVAIQERCLRALNPFLRNAQLGHHAGGHVV